MNEELQQKLFEKYPAIFRGRTQPVTQNLMAFGLAVGDGWYDIIDGLCDELKNIPIDIKAVQVKEKFGGLRFYVDMDYDHDSDKEYAYAQAAREAIDEAEQQSTQTCEKCGAPGEPRSGGWIKTLCNDCAEPNKRGM